MKNATKKLAQTKIEYLMMEREKAYTNLQEIQELLKKAQAKLEYLTQEHNEHWE